MSKKIITSALPYPHGRLHLGRVVGAYLPADITARWSRAMGDDVIFVSGTDDHGVGIEMEADKLGWTYSQVVTHYRDIYRENFRSLGIEFDLFDGTDTPEHEQVSHDFFHKIYEQGLLLEKSSEQMYCETCQKFLPDRYINGTCPKCSAQWQNGDQCEKCGSMLTPEELINPSCKTCKGTNLVVKSTRHLQFQLQMLQWDVAARLETKRTTWRDNVVSTALDKWIKDDLKPRDYTRDVKCGISVPLAGYEDKTIYVWFEAPLGYISITQRYLNQQKLKGTAKGELSDWRQNPDCELIHFIGKDNTVFHSISRPSQIIAYNNISPSKYILPTQIPANEFLNLEGKKFSTSRGYAIWVEDIARDYDPEFVRYYLTMIIPETSDSNFYRKEFQDNANNLTDVVWNLVSRLTTLLVKYNHGLLLNLADITLSELDQALIDQVWMTRDSIIASMWQFRIRESLATSIDLFRAINKYLNDTTPWTIAKTDVAAATQMVSVACHALMCAAQLLTPFLPNTSKKILSIFTLWDSVYQEINPRLNSVQWPIIPLEGYLFAKISDEQIQWEIDKLQAIIDL
jgi:methionyl-tRNA synthetase